MSKITSSFSKFYFLPALLLIFALSVAGYSQEHPLSGKKYGSLIFMKNSTTDNQDNYFGDSANFMETSKDRIPDIWVRAFLKDNIQHYIDYMKKNHEKINYMNFLFAYTISPVLYVDGKEYVSQQGNRVGERKGEEKINVDNFSDYSVNTVQFKFSDFESFVKAFNFEGKSLQANQMKIFKISCTLKFQCTFVNALEKTKTEFYKDSKGSDILAIKSEETDISKYDFFKLLFK